MKPYIVLGMICYNEEKFCRYSIGSLYPVVDSIIVVDHYSTDKTREILKELDVDKKITIIDRKWDNSYRNARNTYLEHIKKNIYPKHKRNLWYWRLDGDEVYWSSKVETVRDTIMDNPDKEGFRFNFYSFTQDEAHLDEKQPTESRANLFKYTPDISYVNDLHEMPVHTKTGTPLYNAPTQDSSLGIMYLPGYWYCHFAWTDVERCVTKAVNYTKHYVKDGTETQEHLDTIKASKDSWWWDKKSSIVFKEKYPEVFDKYGYLPTMRQGEAEKEEVKISAYTIISNAIKYSYPIVESINSVLPIVDEFVVNLGPSDDGTEGLLHKAFDGIEKVKFFKGDWEDRSKGTAFLRNQSNIAQEKCRNKICLYVQADEAYGEWDHPKILAAAKTLSERDDLYAAKFKWLHFDGSFTKVNPDSYPEETRLIKKGVYSIGDAQSFAVKMGDKEVPVRALDDNLLDTDVHTFHYGWVRPPKKMLEKLRNFDSYYHTDEELKEMQKDDAVKHKDGNYDYGDRKGHKDYTGAHPSAMYPYIWRLEKEFPEMRDEKVHVTV